MSFHQSKGHATALNGMEATNSIRVLFGWKQCRPINDSVAGVRDLDLDTSCLMFSEDGVLSDKVWFRGKVSSDGSVLHSGDSAATLQADGSFEHLDVDFSKVSSEIHTLVFVVNSLGSEDFSNVESCHSRLLPRNDPVELNSFDLKARGDHKAFIMFAFRRVGSSWAFTLIGEPVAGRTSQETTAAAAFYA